MDLFQALAQNHARPPTVSMSATVIPIFDCFEIRPDSLHVFQDLIRLKFTFKTLRLETMNGAFNVEEAIRKKLLKTVATWLRSQSRSLENLYLSQRITNGTLTLPQLPLLTELKLDIFESEFETRHTIQPLQRNQFPALRYLELLIRGQRCFEIFAQIRLPSLKNFSIFLKEPATRFTSSLKTVLPNITKLSLEGALAEDLAVVLTQFPQLIELQVDFRMTNDKALKYWDIWTGGASRPLNTEALFKTQVNANLKEPEEMNGCFRVPSLRNMKVLKKLKCSSRTNVYAWQALVYMTLAKSLVPLQELDLSEYAGEINKKIRREYKKVLAKYHKKATINY